MCCPFRKTHERRLQHHAVLKNRDLSVSFLLGAGLFPGGDVQHQRVQRRARFPDALRTVCYRARVEVDPAFFLFRKRRVGGDFQREIGRASCRERV